MIRERDELAVPRGSGDSQEERAELRGAAAGVVAGLGAYLAVQHLSEAGTRSVAGGLYDLPFVLLSMTLLYAGCWLLRSDFCHRRVARVALWSLAGFLSLVAIGVWLSGGRTVDVHSAVTLAVDVGTVGATSGLLVGLCGERRRRQLDRDASVAVDRAEERFAFFNRLLRHHLLNGVAVVRGHAELLAEERDDPPETIEIIRRRSDEVVHLVRNVETLSRAFTGDLPVYAVDPGPPLRAAVESARADGAVVDVRGDFDEGVRVLANDRQRVVFEAVVDAAVETTSDGRIAVETTQRGGEFSASIVFDGSLAEDPNAPLPVDDHDDALGLLIAETLVEYFGGSLALTTEGGTSVLEVRLPLAD